MRGFVTMADTIDFMLGSMENRKNKLRFPHHRY